MPQAPERHNLIQGTLALWAALGFLVLCAGLWKALGQETPDLGIVGSGSSATLLSWYQDRGAGAFPTAKVFTLPFWAYRVALLTWGAWVLFALRRWIPWMRESYARDGLWKSDLADAVPTTPPAPPATP